MQKYNYSQLASYGFKLRNKIKKKFSNISLKFLDFEKLVEELVAKIQFRIVLYNYSNKF